MFDWSDYTVEGQLSLLDLPEQKPQRIEEVEKGEHDGKEKNVFENGY